MMESDTSVSLKFPQMILSFLPIARGRPFSSPILNVFNIINIFNNSKFDTEHLSLVQVWGHYLFKWYSLFVTVDTWLAFYNGIPAIYVRFIVTVYFITCSNSSIRVLGLGHLAFKKIKPWIHYLKFIMKVTAVTMARLLIIIFQTILYYFFSNVRM